MHSQQVNWAPNKKDGSRKTSDTVDKKREYDVEDGDQS